MDASYTFRLFRPYDAWRDAWVEYTPYGRLNFRLGFENGIAMLAKVMIEDGKPDGDVEIKEVGGKLIQNLESLYRLAELCPTLPLVSLPVYNALLLLKDDHRAWQKIDCKLDLMGRGFVTVNLCADDLRLTEAFLTDDGREAIHRYGQPVPKTVAPPKVEQPTTISTASYLGLRYVRMAAWASVHQATKTGLLNRGFVVLDDEMPTVTEAGETAITEYEAVNGAKNVRAPEPAKGKPVVLTANQIEAFRIVTKQPYKWGDVPTRTANHMIDVGWIIMRQDFPKITPEGAQVHTAYLASLRAIKKAA